MNVINYKVKEGYADLWTAFGLHGKMFGLAMEEQMFTNKEDQI